MPPHPGLRIVFGQLNPQPPIRRLLTVTRSLRRALASILGLVLGEFSQHVRCVVIAGIGESAKLIDVAPFASELDELIDGVLVAVGSLLSQVGQLISHGDGPFSDATNRCCCGVSLSPTVGRSIRTRLN